MENITPYFDLNGQRYYIKKTRWLSLQYEELANENRLTAEETQNATHAQNLLADYIKYRKKADELWDALCEDPTDENQRKYMLFKSMSDKALSDYNNYIAAESSTMLMARKKHVAVLEKMAIKSLAEQYFSMDEARATSLWGDFVDTFDDHNQVAEWLDAMAEAIFGRDEEESDADNNGGKEDFLEQMRKRREQQEQNRKNAIRKS